MITRPKPLRVLPCFDSTVLAPSIAVLRSTVGVDLLSLAPASTLVYRALSDEPDAIVIVTEDFGSVAGRNDSDLIEVFSSTPTVLLSGQGHAVLRKRAAAFHIRSVLPLQVTSINCSPQFRLRWRAWQLHWSRSDKRKMHMPPQARQTESR